MNFPQRPQPKNGIMLTSMMDMFTIILVFLLYNFSAEEQKELALDKSIRMPYSSAEQALERGLMVTVSKSEIKVADKIVARLSGSTIHARTEGQKIIPLYEELLRVKRLQNKTHQQGEAQDVILLQADQAVTFTVLDKVLKSAGMAGYPKSRFLVIRRES